MDWQVAAIIAIVLITVTGFVRDEWVKRREIGRPLKRLRGNELHVPRPVRQAPVAPAPDRVRRLRAVGF
jgi:hypothetical protein